MHKHMKGSDGLYHIKGKTYKILIGSRAQVVHGTAYKTSGNLTSAGLIKNKSGHFVSKKKSATATKEKRLEEHGYFAKKGRFGAVKGTPRRARSKRSRRSTKKRARTV